MIIIIINAPFHSPISWMWILWYRAWDNDRRWLIVRDIKDPFPWNDYLNACRSSPIDARDIVSRLCTQGTKMTRIKFYEYHRILYASTRICCAYNVSFIMNAPRRIRIIELNWIDNFIFEMYLTSRQTSNNVCTRRSSYLFKCWKTAGINGDQVPSRGTLIKSEITNPSHIRRTDNLKIESELERRGMIRYAMTGSAQGIWERSVR